MTNKNPDKLATLFRRWQAEDDELARQTGKLRNWMRQVSEVGTPDFGEAAHYLGALRDHLVEHFVREDGITKQIAECNLATKMAVAALNFEISRDHESILAQLDDLVARLNEWEPPFESWQAAMDEVEQIVAALEQHEEQEARTIESLLPH